VAEHPLAAQVRLFIDDLVPVLSGLASTVAGIRADQVVADVTTEAFNVAAAFIDADGNHTDDELIAILLAFASRIDSITAYGGPEGIRKSGVLDDRRSWLDQPSLLFDTLVRVDGKDATSHAWAYYEGALAIAHTVTLLDGYPSRDELQAIDTFRSMLLKHMEAAGVRNPRSGQPVRTTLPASAASQSNAPVQPARPLEDLLAELDGLIGLAGVKAEVKLVANLIQVQNLRKKRGLPTVEGSRHLVFTGNPGTGKTTVARLLAEIYRTLGVVDKGQLVETDRSGLVAGFVGQTATLVQKVFAEALGGVLLIDEAYALARGGENDFGREAIDTLVKLIEDHRDDVVVVAAGYPDEMATFINANPGLSSRFPKTIKFPDYSTDELVAIFQGMGKSATYVLTADGEARLREFFEAQPRDKGFGNGRLARNLFEAAVARQASRIVAVKDPTNDDLCSLTADDIGPAAPVTHA
jgi:Cdc6-like AAA superfamily ATPase